MRQHHDPHRRRLFLETLEPRDVPAGIITAKLAGGVLTLTGDQFNNTVNIQVNTAVNVVLTPDATTTIDDLNDPAAPVLGAVVTINGTVDSLKLDAKAGNDSVAINPVTAFDVPGAVNFQLGEGNNSLILNTSQQIDLGSLSVKAKGGQDTVSVVGGVGMLSEIDGNASFDYAYGSSTTTLTEIEVKGAGGLKIKDARTGNSLLNATKLKVTKGVQYSMGNSIGAASFIDSTIGSLTVKSVNPSVTLNNSAIGGKVSISGNFQSGLTITGAGTTSKMGDLSMKGGLSASVNQSALTTFLAGNMSIRGSFQSSYSCPAIANVGNISMTSGFVAQLNTSTGNFAAGNIRVKASFQSIFQTSSPTFTAGDVSLSGSLASIFTSSGIATVDKLSTSPGQLVQFSASGTSLTVNGDLNVRAGKTLSASFGTTALSELKGNAKFSGGSITAGLQTNQFFEAERDLKVDFKGTSQISIGAAGGIVPILGKLTIKTGKGDDSVILNRVDVTGAASISTGAGTDTLTIQRDTKFNSTFSADMGADNDTIAIAQTLGSTSPVTFIGLAKIKAGAGNDTLSMGVDPGDLNSLAAFTGALANVIDGGSGLNTFDGLTPAISPAKYTGLTAANFLNWTDPNP